MNLENRKGRKVVSALNPSSASSRIEILILRRITNVENYLELFKTSQLRPPFALCQHLLKRTRGRQKSWQYKHKRYHDFPAILKSTNLALQWYKGALGWWTVIEDLFSLTCDHDQMFYKRFWGYQCGGKSWYRLCLTAMTFEDPWWRSYYGIVPQQVLVGLYTVFPIPHILSPGRVAGFTMFYLGCAPLRFSSTVVLLSATSQNSRWSCCVLSSHANLRQTTIWTKLWSWI